MRTKLERHEKGMAKGRNFCVMYNAWVVLL